MMTDDSSRSSNVNSSRSSSAKPTYYQRLLDSLQSDENIDKLTFDYKLRYESNETIDGIIRLMHSKASVTTVRIYDSITTDKLIALFDAIVTLPTLTVISINYDIIVLKDPNLIHDFVAKLHFEGRKLKSLYIGNINFGDELGVAIVEKIRMLTTLEDVTLNALNFGNKTAFAIADWLQCSSNQLKNLHLYSNPNIGPEGHEVISNSLENNFALCDLCINNLTDQKVKFYLLLNRCNRNKMMCNICNNITRDIYINNMIDTLSNGRDESTKLSLYYYWIRTKPFSVIDNEDHSTKKRKIIDVFDN